MAYDASEVKGIIDDVLMPFRDLDDAEKEAQQIEAGTFDWASIIPAELGDPVPAVARFATEIVSLMDQVLSIPTRPVVNLSRSGTTADKEKDALEVYFDYWRYRTDPHGAHRRMRREHTIRSRFAVNILSAHPYQPDGSDEYDESYWRHELHSPDPKSIGVLRKGADYTLGVLEEEIPYLEMAKYLSGREAGQPARDFLTKKLGGLVLADGSSPWSDNADSSRLKKIKRCIVYTDEDICQYINVKDEKSYAQVEDTEPNPFGQVPIVLFPGIYRSHMQVKEAYEGLMGPAMSAVKNLILMNSIALTIYGNQRLIDQVEPDVARQLIEAIQSPTGQAAEIQAAIRNLILPMKDEKGQRGISIGFGQVADMSRQLDATFATALQFFQEDLQRILQQWQSVFPDPETIRQGRAASVIAGIEQGQRRAENPLGVLIAGEQRLFEMVAYDIANTHKQDVKFKPSEYSLTVGRDNFESGSDYAVTPDMMRQFVDGSAVISLEPVPATGAQRAAAVMEEIEIQSAVGVVNPKRLYEAAGESNVTARLEEDAALTNASYLGPGAAQFAMQDVINEFALEQERDAEQMRALWTPQFQQQQGGGGGPAGGGGGYQFRSPERQPVQTQDSAPV